MSWLFICIEKQTRGYVDVVRVGNHGSNMGDNIFQLGKLIDLYRVASSIDLEKKSNFHVAENIFVDVEELNVVLSSNKHVQVDEDDDINEINTEHYNRVDDKSIEELTTWIDLRNMKVYCHKL